MTSEAPDWKFSPVEAMRALAAAVCQRRSQSSWGNDRDDAVSGALRDAAEEIREIPIPPPLLNERRDQPAATAPKDRTIFLAWGAETWLQGGPSWWLVAWNGDYFADVSEGAEIRFTRWHPLPPPPEGS